VQANESLRLHEALASNKVNLVGLGEGQAAMTARIQELQEAVSAGQRGASEELATVRSLQAQGGKDTLQALQVLAEQSEGQVTRTLSELQRMEGGQGKLSDLVSALAEQIRAAAEQAKGAEASSAKQAQEQLSALLGGLGEQLQVATMEAQGTTASSTAALQTLLAGLGEQLQSATQQVQGASALSAEATQQELKKLQEAQLGASRDLLQRLAGKDELRNLQQSTEASASASREELAKQTSALDRVEKRIQRVEAVVDAVGQLSDHFGHTLTHAHVHTHVNIHTYAHTYTHTHTHTHTHTYTLTQDPWLPAGLCALSGACGCM
jgi:hypothetical protein